MLRMTHSHSITLDHSEHDLSFCRDCLFGMGSCQGITLLGDANHNGIALDLADRVRIRTHV